MISCSYDHEIAPISFVFDQEKDKNEFLELLNQEAAKFAGPLPQSGHVFIADKGKKGVKCNFCSDKSKNQMICSVCQIKIHPSCKVHCDFLDSCLLHYEKGVDACLPTVKSGEGQDERYKQALATLSNKIKTAGFVELDDLKIFELLAYEALNQFPMEFKARIKVTPPSPIFDYDCFKDAVVLNHCHIAKFDARSPSPSVGTYLCSRVMDEKLPLLKRSIAASLLSALAAHTDNGRHLRYQILGGNLVPPLVKIVGAILDAENVKKDKSEANSVTDYDLEQLNFASKIANCLQYSLVDDHPQKNSIRDEVLKPLIKAALIAVDIIYHEKSKGAKSNQCARTLLSSIICCAAPPVHYAYKESESWMRYIAEVRGLAIILCAAELSYYTIHPVIKAEEVTRTNVSIYSGPAVKVMEAVYRGETVVLKEFSFGDDIRKPPDWFMKEVTIQSLVGKHPNACSLYGAFSGPNPDDGKFRAALLLEKYSRQSLAVVMSRLENIKEDLKKTGFRKRPKDWVPFFPMEFDTQFTINCILQACSGVAFLHQKGIMHRDIKPQNILCGDNYQTVICDFGISRVVPAEIAARTTRIGTTPWMAPELLIPDKVIKTVKYQSDVYSMAVVLWQLIAGKANPYFGMDCFQNVPPPVNYRETIPEGTHPELKTLIEEMWAPNPSDRPTMQDVLDRLWVIKDPKGRRYAGRYELMTEPLWHHLASFLDKKTKTALAICSKAHCKVFHDLASSNKSRYEKKTKAAQKAFTKPTQIKVGNKKIPIALGVSEWSIYVAAEDGTTKSLEGVVNQVTFNFPQNFYIPAVTLTKEPFTITRTGYESPSACTIQITLGKKQTATIIHHLQFTSDDFHTVFPISDIVDKQNLISKQGSPEGKLSLLPKALVMSSTEFTKKTKPK